MLDIAGDALIGNDVTARAPGSGNFRWETGEWEENTALALFPCIGPIRPSPCSYFLISSNPITRAKLSGAVL